MEDNLRQSGISAVGKVPWGTHFCQFYQTKQDLLDILVPYFKAGLENNEFCMWVTSKPLSSLEAKKALKAKVSNLDKYIKNGQIEILDYKQWYVKNGRFEAGRVLDGWVKKEKSALKNGFEGLRLTGNTFWLEKKDWRSFVDYEKKVDSVIGKYKIVAICTYSLNKCGANELIDVINNHQFALIKRNKKWSSVESSQRKKTELALAEAQIDLSHAQAVAHVGSWRLNVHKNELLWSDETYRIFGIPKDTPLTYESFLESVHPDDRKYVDQKWNAALRREPYDIEHRIIVEGNIKWVRERAELEFDSQGKLLGGFGTVQDITERKKIYEALSKERQNLQAIFDVVNIGMLLIAEDGSVKRVNDTVTKWVGKDLSSFPKAQQPGNIIGCVHAISNPEGCGYSKHCSNCSLRKSFETVLKTGEPVHEIETKVTLATNGKTLNFWLEINADPLLIDGKRHAILSMSDITVRKQAEEILRRDKQDLEKLIQAKIEELNATQRLSEIGKLAATVAHELRNPLGVISIASYNLKKKSQDPLLHKHITNIEKKVAESQQIINNLLLYSRIKTPDFQIVSLLPILEECTQAAKDKFENVNIAIEKDFSAIEKILFQIDSVQIKEVFTNLLNNAAEAVLGKAPLIKVFAKIEGRDARICFQDNGCGINEEILQKIAEPFFTTKSKGTGLGLTLCYEIIKLHNGRIEVESQKDKGSLFCVILPVKI